MIVLDGGYTEHKGQPRFHPVGTPARGTLERLLDRLISRTLRSLLRDGVLTEDPEQPRLDLQDPDALDQLNSFGTTTTPLTSLVLKPLLSAFEKEVGYSSYTPDIEANEEKYGVVYCECEPGEVIVHHVRTVHGSTGNTTSDRSRDR